MIREEVILSHPEAFVMTTNERGLRGPHPAEPKPGYDLTLALLVLDAADKGTGEFTTRRRSSFGTTVR